VLLRLVVKRVVFSPNGKKLASASYDDTLQLWDVKSGQLAEESSTTFTPLNMSPLLHFDDLGFLRHLSKPLLWLPPPLRGYIATYQSFAAIGSYSGAVIFIRWPIPLSHVGA
jgi:WD40 repeat protein